jgi:signal peptidase I
VTMSNNCLTLSGIAVDMIRQSLESGVSVVVCGTGTSMEPTIRSGDKLKIVAADTLSVEDVVLIQVRPDAFVAHRIIKIEETQEGMVITTKGDNLSQPDFPVPRTYVIGKVDLIFHMSTCEYS